MLKNLKKVLFIGLVVCGIGYAGYTLVDPPTHASAATCCAFGVNCGAHEVCCRPDACTLPCAPSPNIGYCMSQCPPPC